MQQKRCQNVTSVRPIQDPGQAGNQEEEVMNPEDIEEGRKLLHMRGPRPTMFMYSLLTIMQPHHNFTTMV